MKLTGVDDGSAIPIISLFVAASGLFPQQNQIYFEQARERIVNAIDAAEHNQPITAHLPESLLGYFDRLGRSLRHGEFMELDPSNQNHPGRLNKDTRRKLILTSGLVEELTDEVVLRGSIPEVDQDRMTFTLQLAGGQRIAAKVESQHALAVLDAFNRYRDGARVIIQGVATFSRNSRLQRLDTVEHVSLLDRNDIPTRLEELRSLQAGWLDGKGAAPTDDGLEWLSRGFESYYPDDLPLPYLYPTGEGGVQAEWSLGSHEISLDISLGSRRGEWHSLALDADREDEVTLDLNAAADWSWVAGEIRRLAGVEAP